MESSNGFALLDRLQLLEDQASRSADLQKELIALVCDSLEIIINSVTLLAAELATERRAQVGGKTETFTNVFQRMEDLKKALDDGLCEPPTE